jgi:hypothetical protein
MRHRFAKVLFSAALVATAGVPGPAVALDPGSQLIGCELADTLVTVSTTSHLDPSCTWTRGIEIVASDVTLDCQGAQIVGPTRRVGIHIVAPTTVALSNVTVRNCHIEGFLNNVRVEREGFRDLAEGVEYDHAFSDIVIEDSTILNSRGVGIFVDGYVTGVTLQRLHVEGAGSTGIYLEAGSKDNVVEDNDIVNNGYGENGPAWQLFDFAGVQFWFYGIGREGLAIDGSRFNRVANNRFSGNSAGAIFLYKNCGEFVNARPERWWHRRYGADGNLIESNTITDEDNGVWIGSRMGENVLPMDCSDPQYAAGFALDYADDNVVRNNVFTDTTYGVRVEDDRAVVDANQFVSADPGHVAVIVGTPQRTTALGLPVDGTTVTGNDAAIAGNTHPYRWVHGHMNTTFTGNESLDRVVGLCEGVPPARGPFVFTVAFQVATDPETPPTGDPALPLPSPLPPCPTTCETGGAVVQPRLTIQRLHTLPGDDMLSFGGQLVVPHPAVPALDPVAVGAGVVVADATGARVLDVTIPGGAYDATTRVGWKTSRSGTRWKYVAKNAASLGGITAISVRDLSAKDPGLVRFRVRGKRGSYPADPAHLPLSGLFILDPPTAETGQCAEASFEAPATCSFTGRAIKCRP